MIGRVVTLVFGLGGAVGMSQFPEFSQQYVQRLGGALDELNQVAAQFDRSARAEGLTRQAALDALQGSPFLERRQTDMTAVFTRAARLQRSQDALRDAGPFARLQHVLRFDDAQLARATWQDYAPAIPATPTGLAFAGLGGLAGWGAARGAGRLLARRRTAAGQGAS